MTLVEENRTVEVVSAPLEQLLQSRVVFAWRVTLADERRVGGKDDSLLDLAVVFGREFAVFEFGERVDFDLASADVPQVSQGVEAQVVGDGEPDGALPALTPVLVDDPGQSSAFADSGAVADQKSGASSVRQNLLVLHRRVGDRFQLRGGKISNCERFSFRDLLTRSFDSLL